MSCRITVASFIDVASFDQHVATWRSNEASARRFVEIKEYTWSVTCLFYAALHLIEAHLVREGVATTSHHERWSSIRRVPALQSVQRLYGLLKQESENGRYKCHPFDEAEALRVRNLLYAPLAGQMRRILGVS